MIEYPRPSHKPKDHWVLPGVKSHPMPVPTDEQLVELHRQAYLDGYTVDIFPGSYGGVRVVFNQIVISASSLEIPQRDSRGEPQKK